jgi:hypothetical protein
MKNIIRSILASAVFAVAIPAHATFDLLLSIPGVEGFSEAGYAPDLPGTADTWNTAFSFGAGFGPDGCDEVAITLKAGKATAQIIANGIMGAINERIYLHAISQPGQINEVPVVLYTLNDAVIASVSDSGSDGDDFVETRVVVVPNSITVEAFTETGSGNQSSVATILCSDKKVFKPGPK